MSNIACPVCTMTDVLTAADHSECAVCGHEWPLEAAAEEAADASDRIVKDSNGNVLVSGDSVTLIKELKMKGGNNLKIGTKVRNIRIVDGDHEIDCKVDGMGVMLKAMYVKKA
jgi:protein PhnA